MKYEITQKELTEMFNVYFLYLIFWKVAEGHFRYCTWWWCFSFHRRLYFKEFLDFSKNLKKEKLQIFKNSKFLKSFKNYFIFILNNLKIIWLSSNNLFYNYLHAELRLKEVESIQKFFNAYCKSLVLNEAEWNFLLGWYFFN